MIEFGEWLPDLEDLNNPGCTVAKNVLPAQTSYKQFPGIEVYSDAIGARCQGAYSCRDKSATVFNFCGDASKLYLIGSASWADVSVGGGYTTGASDMWQFAKWNDSVITTNFGDPIQVFEVGVDSAFSNLGGSPPHARYITIIKDFVVLGNINDTAGVGLIPNRVQWCALGDPTDWTPDAATQADYQNLPGSYGWVMQIKGGEYGTIFQERAITRMSYVGSPVIFQFDPIEIGNGTLAANSVIQFGRSGNLIAYLGLDGFYIFDGSRSTSIGIGKIDKTFYADLDQNYYSRVVGCEDPINKILFWIYPGSGNSGGIPNKMLCYNYADGATRRWSYAELNLEFIYQSLGESYTLDGLDAITTDLDALPFPLDSRVWTGNTTLLSAFNTDHKQVNFTSDALDAELVSAELEINPNHKTIINKTRPVVQGDATVSCQIGYRNDLSDSVSYTSTAEESINGEFNLRNNARFQRLKLMTSGNFSHIKGIQLVNTVKGGRR